MSDGRWRVGLILIWLRDGSWSLHIGPWRALWVRDVRRNPLLFGEREGERRYRTIGHYAVRWNEAA